MAGDWIKMRVDLTDDPTVMGICSKLGMDEFEVIGRLHKLWSWADRHVADGATTGVDVKWVDRFVARKGFASAMMEFGWLKFDEENGVLSFPNFNVHNGASAKTRCDAVLRQRKSRERLQGETNGGHERGSIPKPFYRHVFSRDRYTCVYCGAQSSREKEMGKKALLSLDHIAPHSRSDGRQAVEDLVTCCRLCNNEKGDRTPEEWGMTLDFLQPELEYTSHKVVTKIRDNNVTRVTSSPLPEKRREEKSIDLADTQTQSVRGPEPEGWPRTEEACKSQAIAIGVDPEFASAVWNEHDSTGSFTRRDQHGNVLPILKWAGYLKARWTYRQQRQHESHALEKHRAELRGAAQGVKSISKPAIRDDRGQRPGEIKTDVTHTKIPRIQPPQQA